MTVTAQHLRPQPPHPLAIAPPYPRPLAPAPSRRPIVEGAAPTRGRVLIADDSKPIRKMLGMLVRSWGYDADLAADGVMAVELSRHQRYDAILTDIHMPRLDGIALMRQVRQNDADVPIVILTGAPSLSTAIEGIEYGAFKYLIKPIDANDLRQTIDRAAQLGRMARVRREAMEAFGRGDSLAGDRLQQESTFERALETLWMAYQPIIVAESAELFAYEALMRNEDPRIRTPMQMLDLAERVDRLGDLARTIRVAAAAPIVSAATPITLFVNLHPRELLDDTLLSPFGPLAPIAANVVLEVTERAALETIPGVAKRTARLRDLGFRLAIDDLGAGYASLNSFATLEPEFVKIDMTLVRDIDSDRIKRRLVGGMTEICHNLDIMVVAEGVETIAERDVLVGLGCDLLQGYLFARPGRPFPTIHDPTPAPSQAIGGDSDSA